MSVKTLAARGFPDHHPTAAGRTRKAIRVGFISEYFYPDRTGGTGTVLSNLARCLKDSYDDIEIEVVTSRNVYRCESEPLPAADVWDGIKILRLSTPRPNRNSTFLRLAANTVYSSATLLKLLTRRSYDLLLVGTAPPTLAMAAKAFNRMTGTPYVYVIYDLYPDIAMALGILRHGSAASRAFKRLQGSWLHASSKVVVLGRCMKEHLIASYRMPDDQIEVIPIGADAARVFPVSRSTRFRSNHGLSGFVVLYAGNFGRYQNFDTLLDAAKLLRDAHRDIAFVFVGDGAKREHIARRLAEERITNLRMFPFVPEPCFADMLASADVCLLTLEPGAEGLGVPSKFYNILASGRPLVAVLGRQSEVARVVAEADCGIQVDQGDPPALAHVLSQLYHSPHQVERMGQNARRVFVEKYTTQHVAARFYETFVAALEPNRGKVKPTPFPLGRAGEPADAPRPATQRVASHGLGPRTPLEPPIHERTRG